MERLREWLSNGCVSLFSNGLQNPLVVVRDPSVHSGVSGSSAPVARTDHADLHRLVSFLVCPPEGATRIALAGIFTSAVKTSANVSRIDPKVGFLALLIAEKGYLNGL